MKDPNLIKEGSYYGAFKNEFGDYTIINGTVMCHLLIGKEKAMLIDTAYGQGDLLYFIRTLTDLPLIVVNTHGHSDHSGGDGFFKDVYIGRGGEHDASNPKQIRKDLPFSKNINFLTLNDGMIFDLGDREIEAISIPAHHVSSFAFLDKRNRSLYSGDEVESSQVLLFCSDTNESCIERAKKHLENMNKLKARKSEFDRIYPAHNGIAISTDYIDYYIELAKDYINGNIVPEKTVAGFGWPSFIFGGDKKLLRIKKGLVSFIISK